MIMLSTLSNFIDELSENGELREYELSGSDCIISEILKTVKLLIQKFTEWYI